jgi:hypothetical protein
MEMGWRRKITIRGQVKTFRYLGNIANIGKVDMGNRISYFNK